MFVLAPLVNADETHYTAVMSGITWGNCQKDVRGALKTTFQAVNIQIVKKDKSRMQVVTFTASDKSITRSGVGTAMGKNKNKYKVWRLTKKVGEK